MKELKNKIESLTEWKKLYIDSKALEVITVDIRHNIGIKFLIPILYGDLACIEYAIIYYDINGELCVQHNLTFEPLKKAWEEYTLQEAVNICLNEGGILVNQEFDFWPQHPSQLLDVVGLDQKWLQCWLKSYELREAFDKI